MEQAGQDRRKIQTRPDRTSLGDLIRAAIRARVPDSRAPSALWVTNHNLGWVRWQCEDGRYAFCGIRRRLDFFTGEIGVAHVELELDELTLVQSVADAPYEACRIQLGQLLHGQEKWWSSGGSEKTLIERLNWIASQLQQQKFSFLSATLPPTS